MAVGNNLMGVFNILSFLLSIPLIGAGIWLSTKLDTKCVRFLEWPVILIGFIVFLVSLAGIIGAFWRVAWLLWIYLVAMFIVILLLLGFTSFVFIVTKSGPGQVDGYVNYHVDQYSTWLQQEVKNRNNWRNIKGCIEDSGVCYKLLDYYHWTVNNLYRAHLNPLQYGCCMPPALCGYQYISPMEWINPRSVYANEDCVRWSNMQAQLCYDCDSCKGAVMANMKGEWRKVGLLSLGVCVALIILYIMGWCAYHYAQQDYLTKLYLQGYRI